MEESDIYIAQNGNKDSHLKSEEGQCKDREQEEEALEIMRQKWEKTLVINCANKVNWLELDYYTGLYSKCVG